MQAEPNMPGSNTSTTVEEPIGNLPKLLVFAVHAPMIVKPRPQTKAQRALRPHGARMGARSLRICQFLGSLRVVGVIGASSRNTAPNTRSR